jgi:hypothetical protein
MIWIGGDLNLPDIDWQDESIKGNNYPKRISELVIETMQDTAMQQIVNFPTRGTRRLLHQQTNPGQQMRANTWH